MGLVNFVLQWKEIEDIGSQTWKWSGKLFPLTHARPKRQVKGLVHPPRDHGLHKDVKRLNAHQIVFSGFSLLLEKHVGCIKVNQCKSQLPTN